MDDEQGDMGGYGVFTKKAAVVELDLKAD